MKKISLLLLALLLWMVPACDDDSNSSSTPQGTLTVNYDFNVTNGPAVSADPDATKQIWVYLYSVISLFPYEYYVVGGSSAVVAAATDLEGSITIDNVKAGDYYVLVFYDAAYSDKSTARKDDPYMLYDDNDATNFSTESPYTAIKNASLVTITGGATTTVPTSGSMTYDATYHGTEGAAFIDQGGWDLVP